MTDKDMKKIIELEKGIGGLLPDVEDKRDVNAERVDVVFGISGYKPKHQDLTIKTQTTCEQSPLNICGWVSSGSQDEDREKMKLDVRAKVMIARRENLITGDGFSSLRDNQKVSNKWGIPEVTLDQRVIDWESYSNPALLTDSILRNADLHRTASYGQIYSKDAILELLDRGGTIQTGLDWFPDYNMSEGFGGPFIIDKKGKKGEPVGHAVKIGGYALNYHGMDCFRFQQSLGPIWGDKGYFYMPIEYALEVLYSKWVQIDIPVECFKSALTYPVSLGPGAFHSGYPCFDNLLGFLVWHTGPVGWFQRTLV